MGEKLIKITKHGLMSKLYKRDLYTCKDYDYLINRRIIEYDIKSANTNLCRYYGLLPEEEIVRLENLSKQERVKAIGLLQRNDKEFTKKLSKAFKDIRKEFFVANGLDDSNIHSIKKDAIFVVGKRCRNTKFKNIEFVEKNIYSSYHYLNKMEFYYSSSLDILHVKGINDNSLYQFTKFMNILKRMFKMLERGEREEFVKFVKRFVTDYVNKNLTYEYYKEFRTDGAYTLIQDETDKERYIQYTLDDMDSTIDHRLAINYNYIAYLLPMIQRHYFKGLKETKYNSSYY